MKRSLPVAFATLLLFPVLNSAQIWAAPAKPGALPKIVATKTAPRVTRDNFVSLSWQQTGGFAGIQTSLQLQSNVLSYSTNRPTVGGGSGNSIDRTPLPDTRGVSNHQLDALIEKMNQVHLPALVGNYRQPNLADGFNEVLVLTISDKDDRDQHFVIQNYGDKAPRGYFAFVAAFRALAGMKFPNSPFAPTPTDR
ncbi:hypothetical protein IAD21_00693 [Abditibacteriota bacterium]|nr:hypothetical protein IAD21_00693 [Abditibacteriota bacterium]